MKIAIIDHLPVGTGIVRFAYNLAHALLKKDAHLEIHYYTHESNYRNNNDLFVKQTDRLQIKILKRTIPEHKVSFQLKKILIKTGIRLKDKLKLELESLDGYDLYYFTCPHMSPYYKMNGKQFGTFHDFNWKYIFGAPSFSKKTVEVFNESLPQWLNNTVPIVSSEFIKAELEKFFPNHKFPVEVIYLPQISVNVKTKGSSLFDFPYVLYPANLYSHKNHANLFRALYILKQKFVLKDIKLVLTGSGTDHFTYAKLSETGIEESNKDDFDVIGMGYVNHNDMDRLVKNAFLNISTSLYEAGSGPALDAWNQQSPVIISDIPSHRDQLNFWKINCLLFDPLNAVDIAEKISYAFFHQEELREMSVKASELLNASNWDETAAQYLTIFKKYINEL